MDTSDDAKRANFSATKEKSKLPYEAPRVIHREKLEAVAAACSAGGGKIDDVICVFAGS